MPAKGRIVYRHRLSTRLWHWLNALAVIILLMSGLTIFNAHPRLYWGRYGANPDTPWLMIGHQGPRGYLKLGSLDITTTGVLGVSKSGALAFPGSVTIPTRYNLADARMWHFAFAWVLVLPGLAYWLWSFANRHIQHDLAPRRGELTARNIWHDIRNHARLRFPTGEAARAYNILQKLSYLCVLFLALPLAVLTGLTMSPGVNAAWPWLLDLFGGRQSARSLHFIAAMLLALFILVHVLLVLLAGPANELRSIITGRYRLPEDRR